MCKCHNRIANKLELTFEGGVIPLQPLCDVTFFLVILVVRREGTVGVATVKVAFPELCTQNRNIYMYCCLSRHMVSCSIDLTLQEPVVLFLRGASCCVKLLQFRYMPAIATEMFFIYYNLSPRHVSAPTGHPQEEQMTDVLFHLRMARRGGDMLW
jgi:hypothetical protein